MTCITNLPNPEEVRLSLNAVKKHIKQLQRENSDLKTTLEKVVFLLESLKQTQNRTYQDANWLLNKLNSKE